jgi:hypothetical protein
MGEFLRNDGVGLVSFGKANKKNSRNRKKSHAMPECTAPFHNGITISATADFSTNSDIAAEI